MSNRPPSQPYKRVMKAILRQIESGQLNPGDRLPSTRELAEQHDVALMTARRALTALQEEGRAAPTHGVGWFVTEPPATGPTLEERVAALEHEVRELRALIS